MSPSSRTVRAGSSAAYTITIARTSSFRGSVYLGVSGLPYGADAYTSDQPIGSRGTSASITVTTRRSTRTGTYTLTFTGTSNSLRHSTTVTLVVT
jgi:hypothetical protein